jgi:hypothetical protein
MVLFCILGIIFCISPIFGVISSFLAVYFYHDKKYKVLVCFFYLGLFLGVINSLKVPVSDLLNYINIYLVDQNLGFLSYVFSLGKEPGFMLFNYFVYRLTSGSVELYLITFTITCYMLILFSVWKVHNAMKLNRMSFLLSISVVILFPNIFMLSGHLMRQFFAASIILYFTVTLIFYEKKSIFHYTLAALIHTTSTFFGILYLPFLNGVIKLRQLVILAVVFGAGFYALFNFANFFLSVFGNVPILSLILYRLTVLDTAWETSNLGFINFLLQFLIVFIFYLFSINETLIIWRLKIQKLVVLSLMLFMFVAVNYNNTEIALRFSFYMYFLFPIATYFVPFLIFRNKSIAFEKLMFLFAFGLFSFWFFYKINYGRWVFKNLDSLFFLY